MRILHVINSVHPRIGGPREGIAQLAGQLLEGGDRVEVASCADMPDSPWVKKFPIPVNALGPSYLHYAYSPKLIPWLTNNIHRFDVLIVNGLWQYQGLATYWVARAHNKPYLVFTHGMLDPWSRRAYPLKYLKKIIYWGVAEYRVLREASATLFTTDEEQVLARSYFPIWKWRGVVIGYGIGRPEVDKAGACDVLFKSFPILKGKRIVLSLSRIHEKKGLDILIRAFAEVCSADSDFHLLIAGDGEPRYVRRLKALALSLGLRDNITWTGLVDGEMKWGAFYAADLFALASHQENFGLSVAEALACSKAVLITTKVNIWREIEAHGAGFVCADNLHSVARGLNEWVRCDRERLNQMQSSAVLCFEKHFTAKGAAVQLRKTIEGAIQSRSWTR